MFTLSRYPYTSVAFEVVCSSTTKILYASDGFDGSYNDISIVKFNSLVNSLKTDQVKQITCKENRVTILLIFAFSCSPIINLRAKKRMEQCKPCVEHG